MKIIIIIAFLGVLQGCGGFQAKRVGAKESDEKALTITNKWLSADTEQVVKELSQKIEKHRGFRKYLRSVGKTPAVFISDVKNLTSESGFPINDINDEFLNSISESGDFLLVDRAARDTLIKEIQFQNDGAVDPSTAKMIGKQTGADLLIFGNVFMRERKRDGKTIKQYSINLRMTDIERGVEVLRVRTKVSKYSEE
ncbi:penicillin-binding protein activator LpoB [Bacteriovoracales bacterium]|nr:penicillin-binding protein activator LpoB [Bacteriovoracales bacterium]